MKIDVYAMPFTAVNSNEIVGYSFDVVMSHDDGKKTELGEYNVSTSNKITGQIDYEDEEGMISLNKIKDIIIGTGLDGIVDGVMSPKNYFWSTEIKFPQSCDLTGAFQRADELYKSDKVKRTTKEEFETMMEISDMLDREPEFDVRPYDGFYGRDEYDEDEELYDNGDKSGKRF